MDFLKKLFGKTNNGPYKDETINHIYNLLFCDNLELYITDGEMMYPLDVLFATNSSQTALQGVADDITVDPRYRVLACNKLLAGGHIPENKKLSAVIIEVAMNEGLDVLAAFSNCTARYINHTGKLVVWETPNDTTANELITSLFTKSIDVVNQIGPWDKKRLPPPVTGNARMTFLVSDGLYFGEAPIEMLYNDPMAGPVMGNATQLLQFLTEKCQ
jgi:hypothetical protein